MMPTKLYRTKKRQGCPRMRYKHAGQAAAHRNQHKKAHPLKIKLISILSVRVKGEGGRLLVTLSDRLSQSVR